MGRKKNEIYAVVGVGRFGLAVAQTLLSLGKDVIAIDINPQRLKPLEDTSADVFVVDEISLEAFEQAGLGDCRCVIIGVGKDIEASILAALNAKELGAERVICKVINPDHAKILKKIGVEVIFPELDTGRRLAMRLSSNVTEDIFTLTKDFSIIQVKIPSYYNDKTVIDLDFRRKYGVNIIAIVRDGKVDGQIGPQTMVKGGDYLVVAGKNSGLDDMQEEFDKRSE